MKGVGGGKLFRLLNGFQRDPLQWEVVNLVRREIEQP